MKNICIVVDKPQSALDIISRPIMKHNPHLNITICPVHPKRPNDKQLQVFEHFGKKADVIHFQYWRSAELIKNTYKWVKDKKTVLTHNNPYDLKEKEWNYDTVCVNNSYQKSILKYAYKVPLPVDLDFYKFKREYNKSKVVNMVAGRIESSKGILEVAKACKDLGYQFTLVGRISDGNYYNEIKKVGVDFKEDIEDEELKQIYHESAIHVCNSKDGFESGTLPILEAMATGCPVLTRRVGHVPDLENGDNMVVREGEKEDIKDLKKELKALMEDRKKRLDMRGRAYKTVIGRDARRYARAYSVIYQQTYYGSAMASVIIPTFNRLENLINILRSLKNQTYKNFEVVVADDGTNKFNCRSLTKEINEVVDYPIKYINTTDTDEYHLAKARNMAVVESVGDTLIFIDDRFEPEKDAIAKFMNKITNKVWLYGDKGPAKKSFVENFSAVLRQDFINGGMFNERIEQYGGMSQEIRERYGRQGFIFDFVDVKAEVLSGSKSRYSRLEDIKESKFLLSKLNL